MKCKFLRKFLQQNCLYSTRAVRIKSINLCSYDHTSKITCLEFTPYVIITVPAGELLPLSHFTYYSSHFYKPCS